MVDTTAPTTPGTPVISNPTGTSLTLTWTASTDAVGVSTYRVYNKGALLTTSPAGASAWTAQTLPVSSTWNAIAFGNNTFAAMTAQNTINATSPDGITWTQRANTGFPYNWVSMAYGASKFVVVASDVAYALTSSDGVTWAGNGAGLSVGSNAVAYGSGIFAAVATGSSAVAFSSPDGVTWTQRALPITAAWNSLAYGSGIFVAVASNTGSLATSPDGITWTSRAVSGLGLGATPVSYGNGVFLILSNSSTTSLTSTDGVTWTTRTMPVTGWLKSTFGGGLFMAITASNGSYTSPDAITWTALTLASQSWTGLAYGYGAFVAIRQATSTASLAAVVPTLTTGLTGLSSALNYSFTVTALDPAGNESAPSTAVTYGDLTVPTVPGTPVVSNITATALTLTWTGATDNVAVSQYRIYNKGVLAQQPGTISWTTRTMPSASGWSAIGYGNGLFVAFCDLNYAVMAISADGVTWTQRPVPVQTTYSAVTYGGGLFVAVSSVSQSNNFLTSPDGLNWTPRSMPINKGLTSVAYGGGKFVVTTNNLYVYVSSDGIAWAANSRNSMAGVTYGNGQFVGVISSSALAYTSPDGVTWTTQALPVSSTWGAIAFGNGVFVALVTSGAGVSIAATSPDGITWTQQAMPSSSPWKAVTFGNGLFVAVAYGGPPVTAVSPDGITWTSVSFPVGNTNGATAVAFGGGVFASILSGQAPASAVIAPVLTTKVNIDTTKFNYSYTVTAIDAAGNESTPSAAVQYGDWTLPTTPGTPVLTSGSTSTVLSWSPSTDNTAVTGYRVYNKGVLAASAPSTLSTGTWTQRTLPAITGAYWNVVGYGSTSYFYALTGLGSGGVGAYSADGIAWTQIAVPDAQYTGIASVAGAINVIVVRLGEAVCTRFSTATAWTARTMPSVQDWIGVAASASGYCAVSNSAAVAATSTSTGSAWAAQTLPAAATAITYGTNFVALLVTADTAAVSTVGATWISYALPASGGKSWLAVAYGAGVYVAVASNSSLAATSPDGVTWTARTLPVVEGWNAVSYGNGVFIASTSASVNFVAVSADGINWYLRTLPSATAWASAAYGAGVWALLPRYPSIAITAPTATVLNTGLVSAALNPALRYSFTVTAVDAAGNESSPSGAVLFGDVVAPTAPGQAVVSNGTSTSLTLTWAASTDAVGVAAYRVYKDAALYSTGVSVAWTQLAMPIFSGWRAVAYGNGLFVAISDSAAVAATSPDGITWTQRTVTSNNAWAAIVYGAGLFVAPMQNAAMTSPDGITWTSRTMSSTVSQLTARLAYGNSLFVTSVYGQAQSVTSPDGITWTTRTLPTSAPWGPIAYGAGLFVQLSFSTTALTSPDGITWTSRTLPASVSWNAMAYGAGLFVAAAYNSTVSATSPDGITWTQRALPVTGGWAAMTFGGGLFALVDRGAAMSLTSPDGITWTQTAMPGSAGSYSVAYGAGVFVAPGYNTGVVATAQVPTRTVNVTGLTPGTSYSFTATAIDAAGNESNPSVATLYGIGTPATPSTVQLTGATRGVTVSWAVADGADSYTVYRNGVSAGSTAGLSLLDTGITVDGTYTYTVTATNSSGTSPASPGTTAVVSRPAWNMSML